MAMEARVSAPRGGFASEFVISSVLRKTTCIVHMRLATVVPNHGTVRSDVGISTVLLRPLQVVGKP